MSGPHLTDTAPPGPVPGDNLGDGPMPGDNLGDDTAPGDSLVAGYAPLPGVADELMGADGTIRPVWHPLIAHLDGLTPAQIAAHVARGTTYLQDAGVYYRHYDASVTAERNWPFSALPVMIAAHEWQEICAGLRQRADLLEAVMADLYGPGTLVSQGHLPSELICQSPDWLRPMVGVPPKSGHYLHLVSFELSRNPDGSWFVLGDRTQAPSGAGFALENRMAAMRVFPDLAPRLALHRLAGFFHSFRKAMAGLPGSDLGRTAILTPGPGNASYFEHAYIARYLGVLLLEGEDMIARDGRLMVRTVEGLQPLSTLWRRVDSEWADPLELREDSQLGTPGLVNTLRGGGVHMINALGAGILEMRAMMAFLPKICDLLTGAPLRLPNIATWWCGQDSERAFVQANTDRMMLGRALDQALAFDVDATTAAGDALRDPARAADWIATEGRKLVAQEMVTLSTTPVLQDGRLVPRPMTVRVMAARTPDGWAFMPGGYARIGGSDDATALAMQRGGTVADVWVIGDGPDPTETLLEPDGTARRIDTDPLPSRAADNLFWLGRYIERTENACRLVRAYHLRLADAGSEDDARLTHMATFLSGMGLDRAQPVPETLKTCLSLAQACAGKVRDRFSTDGWWALKELGQSLHILERDALPGDDCARGMGVLLRKINGFTGLVQDNMYRFPGWRFLAIGRALERADGLAAALAHFADKDAPPGAPDIAVELGDSTLTHLRRFAGPVSPVSALDLLAVDPRNPRSVLFQLSEIAGHARTLPQTGPAFRPSPLLQILLPLEARFAVADPAAISAEELSQLRADLARLSDALSAAYLR